MTGKPDAAADWRGKIYDEATHQWLDADPAPADPEPAPAKGRAARTTTTEPAPE